VKGLLPSQTAEQKTERLILTPDLRQCFRSVTGQIIGQKTSLQKIYGAGAIAVIMLWIIYIGAKLHDSLSLRRKK
tara:strand:+ start:1123 stop:1347 length:225 start_codon:yes stop_codon:yes gene_type:complete